ncbi:DUF2490 domain-containing protein [Seonamhaeicola marinus]|uniref:DUF2490 domain-containing protein n=1 Tax=Seonamhaeicola marinus TaxID=1912246 RepID=A0A5D0HFJ8_9FLAO|nr:DUF2490 domain-containing protein [Seonamhaeicola marinus]TYA70076.1 DUF2490 domain-containing protein [Seonamhaeicola marinus]
MELKSNTINIRNSRNSFSSLMNLNMYVVKYLSLVCTIFLSFSAFSQDYFDVLGETTLSFNHSISKKYNASFIFRSRYFLHKSNLDYEQQQVDVFHFSNFNVGNSNKIGFGFYYRNRDWFNSGSDEIRLLQEYTLGRQKIGFKLGHRLRLEQRFFDTYTVYRPRYRFAVDLPLNGDTLDIGEAYFIGSTEALCSISKEHSPLLDQRFTSFIGWLISENVKLQSGLEYRWENYNTKANNYLYFATSALFKI